ncbi:MAG: MarR family winged helix-turn-helix transcriptional regulator [Propionibacteriaceae bacterium]|jgi:DNA-binding MarR family transcriptional regulator|nr:MarR family winged helix-turn-helix transcriptional regulator [Propionibacteriaceae bacterium]
MNEPHDAAWEFWFTVRKAAAILERQLEAIIAREIGLSLGQFMILSVTGTAPAALTQTAIARELGLTKGTVSRLVESAVTAGWLSVTPDPASRRSRLIALTPAGTDLVRRGDRALVAAPLGLYPNANPETAQATVVMLQQFIAAATGDAGCGLS